MIPCPVCRTSYDPERLGVKHLASQHNIEFSVDVKCLVCGTEFVTRVTKETTFAHRAGWRKLWRKQPEFIKQAVESKVKS